IAGLRSAPYEKGTLAKSRERSRNDFGGRLPLRRETTHKGRTVLAEGEPLDATGSRNEIGDDEPASCPHGAKEGSVEHRRNLHRSGCYASARDEGGGRAIQSTPREKRSV